MSDLPVNIDSTYPNSGSASRVLHQQHHDAVHELYNQLLGSSEISQDLKDKILAALDASLVTEEELDDAVSTLMTVVQHDADPDVARPTAPAVYWIGSVEPTNADDHDLWLDTSA